MRKKTRKKRKNSFGELAGTKSKRTRKNRFSMDNLKDETAPVLLVAAGVIAANFMGKTIDGFVKPDESSAIKKLIKPVVLAGAGLALKIMTDNQMLKDLGAGMAIGGVLSGVKLATKQNLVENLSGDLEQLNPDLPDIAGYLESGMDGDLSDIDGEMEDLDGDYEDAEVIDGDDDDDLDGDDDDDLDGDDLSGRRGKGGRRGRGGKGGRRMGRRALLPPATEETPPSVDAVDFV